jgi:molybdopterin synthase catalytic subunit
MSSIMARVTKDPISPDSVAQALSRPDAGAQVIFSGVVRNRNDGRPVLAVTYDAHVPLAEKTLRDIAGEACARWGPALSVAVIHRAGTLPVGEVSVVIGIASPHRDEAYQASRYVIEQLKLRTPVWKQEHYADGDSEWLKGHPLQGERSDV